MAGPSSSGGLAEPSKHVPAHQRSSAEAPEVASTLAACSVQLQNLMRMLLQYGPNMSQVRSRCCALMCMLLHHGPITSQVRS